MVDLLVTYMEMTGPPAAPEVAKPVHGAEVGREILSRDDYLNLYRAVGDAVQWDQRLLMSPTDLDAFLAGAANRIFVLRLGNQAVGLCEFDGSGGAEVELTNFGVIPEVQGRGLGPYLLDRALRSIWSEGARRVWLHTDTYDHRKAQLTYRRAGFAVFAERVESFPD